MISAERYASPNMAGEQLRVIEGGDEGKRLRVDADLVIGRTARAEAGRLGGDPEISRVHARISRSEDGGLIVEDLGSANGTFVNGQRISTPTTLELGDSLRMGRSVLQVTDSSGAVPRKPKPATPTPRGRTDIPAEQREQLVITAGKEIGRRLSLSDELIIGRTVSGEGRLSDDHGVSRRHARVIRDATGKVTIEDLGSANGTLVNGERLRGPRVLNVGDSIQIGTTTLGVTAGEAAAAVAPPAQAPARPRGPEPARPVAPPARAPVRPRAPEPARPVGRPAQAPVRPRIPEPSVRQQATPASVLPPGSVFAGYRVGEVIGHGDMGVVYRAEELALQRTVALKVINAERSREERFRERFARESKLAASIDHQNVIPIFDAGEEQGVMFVTMRLVEGTDLRAVIAAEGHVEPLRAARIVRQVGAALDAAHAQGVLHRDVKPSNVLLDRSDHAYLADFGLAKQASASADPTRHGSIVARVQYVAPEQLLDQPVDARADVYGLGCLLFETLTGQAPFASWADGPRALAPVEAPVPSAVVLRPDLPGAFDDVLARAMAKDPDERYPSAGDLGEAALVAAGGLERARPEFTVATGEASFVGLNPQGGVLAATPSDAASKTGEAGWARAGRWAIALAALLLMAAAMAAATHGISKL